MRYCIGGKIENRFEALSFPLFNQQQNDDITNYLAIFIPRLILENNLCRLQCIFISLLYLSWRQKWKA